MPVRKDHDGLAVSVDQVSLDEDLEAWTLGDPANPAFSLPSGERRTAPQVMRQAFATAVAHLSSVLGGAPSQWAWGRLHARAFPALSGADGLGYGPRAAGGDPFTPDAADGGLTATSRAELADDRHAVIGRGERARACTRAARARTPPRPGTRTRSRCGGTAGTCPCPSAGASPPDR